MSHFLRPFSHGCVEEVFALVNVSAWDAPGAVIVLAIPEKQKSFARAAAMLVAGMLQAVAEWQDSHAVLSLTERSSLHHSFLHSQP
jgi:hypothetical protein